MTEPFDGPSRRKPHSSRLHVSVIDSHTLLFPRCRCRRVDSRPRSHRESPRPRRARSGCTETTATVGHGRQLLRAGSHLLPPVHERSLQRSLPRNARRLKSLTLSVGQTPEPETSQTQCRRRTPSPVTLPGSPDETRPDSRFNKTLAPVREGIADCWGEGAPCREMPWSGNLICGLVYSPV